jgi:hypothetical protein
VCGDARAATACAATRNTGCSAALTPMLDNQRTAGCAQRLRSVLPRPGHFSSVAACVVGALVLALAVLVPGVASAQSPVHESFVVTAEPGVRIERVDLGRSRSRGFSVHQSCTELPCALNPGEDDNAVQLHGGDGWSVHSLEPGTELRVLPSPRTRTGMTLTITGAIATMSAAVTGVALGVAWLTSDCGPGMPAVACTPWGVLAALHVTSLAAAITVFAAGHALRDRGWSERVRWRAGVAPQAGGVALSMAMRF